MRTRSQKLDSNNNVAGPEFIELDGIQVAVSDIVYIKPNRANYLSTPLIIEHFDGE